MLSSRRSEGQTLTAACRVRLAGNLCFTACYSAVEAAVCCFQLLGGMCRVLFGVIKDTRVDCGDWPLIANVVLWVAGCCNAIAVVGLLGAQTHGYD